MKNENVSTGWTVWLLELTHTARLQYHFYKTLQAQTDKELTNLMFPNDLKRRRRGEKLIIKIIN